MTSDEFEALKDLPAPEPSEAARSVAFAAALAAFDAGQKNQSTAQGKDGETGLTLASVQTQRRRLMQAKFFNFKIAASIAVLAVSLPVAVEILRQHEPPAPLTLADKATPAPLSPPQNVVTGGPEETPSHRELAEAAPPAAFAGGVQVVPGNGSLDDSIKEALQGTASSDHPAIVQGEIYRPDGTRVDSRPLIRSQVAAANQGQLLPPFGNGAAPAMPARAAASTLVPSRAAPTIENRHVAVASQQQSQWFGFDGGNERTFPTQPGQETHDKFEPFTSNPVRQAVSDPVSTFSIDTDTASYSFVRRALLAGRMPPKDAVRVEEMINYFPYVYARPESAAVPFQPTVTVMPSPWKPTNKLVHIGIKGYEIAAKERPRANLVLLIDTSGSMAPEDRLPLLKNAFRMLLDELKPDDTIGIVAYAAQSGVALEPVRVAERGKILEAIDRLNASGSTNGGSGLQDAYHLAEMHFDKTAVNRVILATDGDFNVGITSHEELKRFIEAKRQTGIYLSVIGVGHDNYNDQLMQTLAQNGNGVAVYADTLNEARKVLVDEASSTLFPIAKDVKIQIEFNPAQVSEYRLLGYETRALKREDFNNDKVAGGEVGSGHAVTAIYEVTPAGAPKFVDDLRYQKPARPEEPASSFDSGELAYLKIRYKLPAEETSKLLALPITAAQERSDIQAVPEDVRFSVAVAAFGQLLRGEPYTGSYSFDDVLALAQTGRGMDTFGYRAEFINLIRLAKSAQH